MFTESFSYAEIIYLLYCYEKWRGRISRKCPIYLQWAHKGNAKPKTFYVVSDNAISLFSLNVSFLTSAGIVFVQLVCANKTFNILVYNICPLTRTSFTLNLYLVRFYICSTDEPADNFTAGHHCCLLPTLFRLQTRINKGNHRLHDPQQLNNIWCPVVSSLHSSYSIIQNNALSTFVLSTPTTRCFIRQGIGFNRFYSESNNAEPIYFLHIPRRPYNA